MRCQAFVIEYVVCLERMHTHHSASVALEDEDKLCKKHPLELESEVSLFIFVSLLHDGFRLSAVQRTLIWTNVKFIKIHTSPLTEFYYCRVNNSIMNTSVHDADHLSVA